MPSPRDASEYVKRDWRSFERHNAEHFASLHGAQGPDAMLAIGDELRWHAAASCPGWPGEAGRAQDLAAHLRLLEVLDRVPAARR